MRVRVILMALLSAAGACAPAAAQSISPADLQKLIARGDALVVLDASRLPDRWSAPRGANTKIILIDSSLGQRAARPIAEREHKAGQFDVLWLTGSAPQWIDQRLPLMGLVRPPEGPLAIAASDLEAILRDELVVALLDIRSPERFKHSQVPGSKWSMPHEVEAIETSLGRDRWLILIDSGEGTSRLVAEQLHRSGRTWVAYVEGGFPAWATRKAS